MRITTGSWSSLYFAYGSNLNAEHRADMGCPAEGLRFLARAELPDRRLAFRRRRQDGTGALDVAPAPGCVTQGAVYEVRDEEVWEWLDTKEGVAAGAYRRVPACVFAGGNTALRVQTYEVVAPASGLRPSLEYRDIVACGMHAIGIDDSVLTSALSDADPGASIVARFFVYGTLQRAQRNHRWLAQAGIVDVAVATVRGTLYDCGAFPALVLPVDQGSAEASEVHGELVTLNPAAFPGIIEQLDALEGFHGFGEESSFYQRRLVDALTREGPRRAWSYVMDAVPASADLVINGRWQRR